MQGIPDETFDLIYLDPPFNSNHDYSAPIGSKAAGAAFKDTWTLNDVDVAWWGQIAEKNSALYKVLDMADSINGESTKSYLIYMAVRIIEMHRILKTNGSLYLHCDPTMSHYLKCVLDSIFIGGQCKNEIIWFKGYRGTPRKTRFQQEHDTIFFYSKSDNYIWNKTYGEYKDKKMSRYNKIDKDGNRYALIKRKRTNGEVYYGKSYPSGKLQGDVISIPTLASTDSERLGYPTQKPLALLERIITASSNKHDLVFDPFCGCATTCLAAERLDRKWIGIDISPKAFDLINDRLEQDAGIDKFTKGAGVVIHRTDIPIRRGNRSKNIKHILYGMQKGYCNGCEIHYLYKDLEVDHIIPSIKGGANDDSNLQLLCGNCNRVKGSRLTMAELKAQLQKVRSR